MLRKKKTISKNSKRPIKESLSTMERYPQHIDKRSQQENQYLDTKNAKRMLDHTHTFILTISKEQANNHLSYQTGKIAFKLFIAFAPKHFHCKDSSLTRRLENENIQTIRFTR